MDLYENTVIGSFLYGLGLEVGAQLGTSVLVSGVDLLQQTPLDQSLGDLLIKAPRYFRLIEFKRATNQEMKEHKKLADLAEILWCEERARELVATSFSIHHIVHIYHIEAAERRVEIHLSERPYLMEGRQHHCTIPELCRKTAATMLSPPDDPSPDLCAHYLRILRSLHEGPKKPTGGGAALLVAVREGIIEYAHLADLTDIWRTHEELIKLQARHERTRDHSTHIPPRKKERSEPTPPESPEQER
ncbi:hypothetical protein BJI69_18000 [Luteibacter rhizovicinus DSM 16549]|uniref:Uncharacterized protein n=1 Tax=Luteibacter rhizovicinus DSM 16549 TaxID=1440763 RepID=A0A1L3EX25_9GAMM|nr:hypothetical protein [Luteibacter rhizovicinus]APG05609.1 hypothetical protein BJI69_18000 [Luteibacter rhizovicinus DSM 16549]